MVDMNTIESSLGLPENLPFSQASTLGTESMMNAVAKNDTAMLNQGEQQYASQSSTPEQKSWWGSVKSWFSNLWGSEKQQTQEAFQGAHAKVAQTTRQKMQEVRTGESMTANFGNETLNRTEYYGDINMKSYADRVASLPMSEFQEFYQSYKRLIESKSDTFLKVTVFNNSKEFDLLKRFGYQKDGIAFDGTEATGIYALTKSIIETQSKVRSMSKAEKLKLLCDFNENGNVGEENTWFLDEDKSKNPEKLQALLRDLGM